VTEKDSNVQEVMTEYKKEADSIATLLEQPTDEIMFESILSKYLKTIQNLAK